MTQTSPFPIIDLNKIEEAPLCIRSLTVFLAKAVYIHLILDTSFMQPRPDTVYA